jgi:hypothetical protein
LLGGGFCFCFAVIITDAAHAGGHARGVRGGLPVRALLRGVFGHGVVLFGGACGGVHAPDEEGDQLGHQGGDRAPCDSAGVRSPARGGHRGGRGRACGVLPAAEDVPVHLAHGAGLSGEPGVAGAEPCGVDPVLLHRPALRVREHGVAVRVHAGHGVDRAVRVLHFPGGQRERAAGGWRAGRLPRVREQRLCNAGRQSGPVVVVEAEGQATEHRSRVSELSEEQAGRGAANGDSRHPFVSPRRVAWVLGFLSMQPLPVPEVETLLDVKNSHFRHRTM